MMKKLAAVVMMGALGCGVGFGQASQGGQGSVAGQSDAQVLQAILVEMRGLHNDVRLGQTTQILLTELEVQRGVVDKALEKRDNARSRVSQMQVQEKNFAAQIPRLEESAKATLDPVQQKRIEDQIDNMNANMENFKLAEPDAASALADAENALRKEQETLGGIQEQLDEVVKKLQPVEK
jgi:hypothetical protein